MIQARDKAKRQLSDRTIGEQKAYSDLDPLDVASGPKRFGRYVALEKLGHGGMGVVYAAYDESLDRKVAIKLLRAKASENTQQRLRREAQAMARLSHPNVVQIYESNEHDGQTFVVMEFVDGVTLREWMQQQKRSRREVLEVFIAAGRGLAAAHDKGLIHRDFKPDNVMIAKSGRVQVMDFGLARGDDEAEEARPHPINPDHVNALSTDLTADGAVIGTPAYMAPEQIEGRKTDPRSDQFSFCVTLWEALFERRPFAASSLSEMSDVVSAGKFDQPERSKVPGWLRRVLRRGLLAEPAQRWPSMHELLHALERDPTRRRWTWIGSTAGVLAFVLAGAWLASRPPSEDPDDDADSELANRSTCELAGREIEDTWNADVRARLSAAFAATRASYADSSWSRANAAIDAWAGEWSKLRAEACLASLNETAATNADGDSAMSLCLEHQRTSLAALLDAWASADVQTVTLALSAASSLPPPSRCASERWLAHQVMPPPEQAVEVARARASLDNAAALRLAGKFEAAHEQASSARSSAVALGWRPLEAEAEFAVGRLDIELGAYESARASLHRAYLAAIAGGHDRLALEAATWLSLVLGDKLAQLDDALSWGRLGLMFVERLGLRDSMYEADLLHAIGLIQDHQSNDEDAKRSLQRALELTIAARGEAHPDVARALHALGGVYWSMGELQAALDSQVRALQLVEDAFGPNHPEVARSLTNMGMVLGRLGKHDDALTAQRRALDIRKAALGSEHPDVAATFDAIGSSLTLRGEYDEALDAHRQALRIFEASLGPQHIKVAATLVRIADAQLGRRDALAALTSARRALGIYEAARGTDHRDVATALLAVGRAHTQLGEQKPAREVLRRALALREAELGPTHPQVEDIRAQLDAL